MLTPRENLLEVIHGGTPEYLVNQRSYLGAVFDPIILDSIGICGKGESRVSTWGVTIEWAENEPGPFPNTTPDKRVITDIEQWREQIITPDLNAYSKDDWAPYIAAAKKVDRAQQFVAVDFSQGVFEKIHYLMGMEDALCGFLEEPEIMHEIVDYMVEWELKVAEIQLEMFQPDALFHADDFGTQRSTMMSKDTFEEFLVPAYKKIYGYWKENGIELIVHHNDAYGVPFVPDFIEMGIDIWQGPVLENNLPELVKTYGGQISFQAGIDNGKFDVVDWSYDKIYNHVKQLMAECGSHYLIPSFTSAGPMTAYEGAYEAASKAINQVSLEMFGACQPTITTLD